MQRQWSTQRQRRPIGMDHRPTRTRRPTSKRVPSPREPIRRQRRRNIRRNRLRRIRPTTDKVRLKRHRVGISSPFGIEGDVVGYARRVGEGDGGSPTCCGPAVEGVAGPCGGCGSRSNRARFNEGPCGHRTAAVRVVSHRVQALNVSHGLVRIPEAEFVDGAVELCLNSQVGSAPSNWRLVVHVPHDRRIISRQAFAGDKGTQ